MLRAPPKVSRDVSFQGRESLPRFVVNRISKFFPPVYLSFSEELEESGDLLRFTLLQREEGTPATPAPRTGRAVGVMAGLLTAGNQLLGLAPAEGEGES